MYYRNDFEWRKEAPTSEGDFFYDGLTPNGKEKILAIVQVVTNRGSENKEKLAVVYIPPFWRGDPQRQAVIHSAPLSEWTGNWAGPEEGLCCVSYGGGR